MDFYLNIMVVDNEKLVAKSIVDVLKTKGHRAVDFTSAEAALEKLKAGKENYDIIVTDINMPVTDGYSFIEKTRNEGFADVKILVLTGYGSIDGAVRAIKLGASGYFEKDGDPELFLFEIDKIAEKIYLEKKMSSLEEKMSSLGDDFYLFDSKNDYVKRLYKLSKQVAVKDVNILITGESGTGKEILSRYIHKNSPRHTRRFMSINCGAIPDTLFESEMFGHVKGAFTDAIARKLSVFEQAEGGTLLLDEIGEMHPVNQVKLLKVLEDRSYCPVGGVEQKTVDCRIICATNQSLPKKINEGSFRQDLYFRINTVELNLPPLRERKEDIPDFAEMFRKYFNKKYQTSITEVTGEALALFTEYYWPGNIRELRQVIERCMIFSENNRIDKKVLELQEKIQHDAGGLAVSGEETKPYKEAKLEFEKRYFTTALEKTGYSIAELAKISGLNRTHLYEKLKSLELKI